MQIKLDEYFAWLVFKDEPEADVVRALARASFELAPANYEHLEFWTRDDELPEASLEALINTEAGPLDPLLRMGIVLGRHCHTVVVRGPDRSLCFSRQVFEHRRHRDTIKTVLRRAMDLYVCYRASPDGHGHELFQGDILDQRLACYGFKREESESDWMFRQRIFPQLGLYWPNGACQFLFGGRACEITIEQRGYIDRLAVEGRRVGNNADELKAFLQKEAQSLPTDPLEQRLKLAAVPNN